eukprot:16088609-Heterocapsa_arctica.AAC.1
MARPDPVDELGVAWLRVDPLDALVATYLVDVFDAPEQVIPVEGMTHDEPLVHIWVFQERLDR